MRTLVRPCPYCNANKVIYIPAAVLSQLKICNKCNKTFAVHFRRRNGRVKPYLLTIVPPKLLQEFGVSKGATPQSLLKENPLEELQKRDNEQEAPGEFLEGQIIAEAYSHRILLSTSKKNDKIIGIGNSDLGVVREINEDSIYIGEADNIYILADGMGGHAAGEVASGIAIKTVAEFIESTCRNRDITWPFYLKKESLAYNKIRTAIKLANNEIYSHSVRHSETAGMGTTVDSLLITNDRFVIGHIGDSRVYRVRGNEMTQLTEDHSLLNDLIKNNLISEEEIKTFPYNNIVTKALGLNDDVEIDIIEGDVLVNDYFLLCSDGLSDYADENKIRNIVLAHPENIGESAGELIALALQNNSQDNISVVLLKVLSLDNL